MFNQSKILVIGFGSDILTDNGISARLVKDLENSELFPEAEYCTFLTSSMDMIDCFSGYQTIVLIDAMKTNNYTVGKLLKLDINDLDYTLHLSNFHDHGFSEILESARKCGYELTTDVHVYGIEIEEAYVFSSHLSEKLQQAYSDVKLDITVVIRNLIEIIKHKILKYENI